jgi:predicted MFS family arabinose efflux permease
MRGKWIECRSGEIGSSVVVGSRLGNVLADQLGTRATIALAGLAPLLGGLWLLLSPVRSVRRLDSLEGASRES